MSRTALLSTITLLAIIFRIPTAALGQPPKEQPNVLLIVADDMSPDLGCYGHTVVKSPNLDRLAHQGVHFTRAYCQTPLCNPSRTTFLSGRRFFRRGMPTPFMPNWFREHGYFVAEFGKVAHGYGLSRELTKWDLQQPASVSGVLEFLSQRHDKPLFVGIGLAHTHVGFNHTPAMLKLYPPEEIKLSQVPPGFRDNHPDTAFARINVDPKRTEAERRKHTARYYAAISTIDELVGELLKGLDRLKLRDNTVVVFTADHGLHLGDKGGVYDKRTLWERATRVPLIVSNSGRKTTGAAAGLVELVDLFPSLCELCGIPKPEGLEGTSFVPLLDDPKRAWKKAVFMTSPVATGRAVRTDRYRYIEWNGGKSFMLYDHQADPDENFNLADDPKHADTMAELAQVLKSGWQAAGPKSE